MKKLLLTMSACSLWMAGKAQTFTTYGPSDPQVIDGGYFSDYSTDGTIIQSGGSMTLSNNATYEHGNLLFQNNGTWNSITGSLDLFAGSGAVTMSGSSAPSFYDLQLANGNTVSVTNTQGIDIGNQLAFGTSTITSTVRSNHTNGAIKFSDDATYTGGASDAQHVNGYVTKAGNDAFIFPIGNGGDRRTLSITAPATSATISAAWFSGNPNSISDPSDGSAHSTASIGSGVMAVTQIGFWDYVLVAGDDDNITVTVSLPDVTYFTPVADLRLVGWNGTQWINLSGAGNASGTTEGSTMSGTIPGGTTISALGIGSSSTPLPVHFAWFHAMSDGCNADLSWRAEEQSAGTVFSIERSNDGRTFQTLAKINATTGSDGEYHYTDAHPAEGLNYYRIKEEAIDGNGNYTAVRTVMISCDGGQIKVYPTATSGTVYVSLPAGYEQARLSLIGVNGQRVTANLQQEGLSRTIDLSGLASGHYMVQVQQEGRLETFKILYQP